MNCRSHLPLAVRGPRRSNRFPPARPTPLFASPHLSPLFLSPYSHTYTTATPQPLCHQSVTHSFPCDGGCTPYPLFPFLPAHPPSSVQNPKPPVVHPLSNQSLTECSSSNPFPLMNIHFQGRTPSPDGQPYGRTAVSLLRYLLTSLPHLVLQETFFQAASYLSPRTGAPPAGGTTNVRP